LATHPTLPFTHGLFCAIENLSKIEGGLLNKA